MLRVTTWTQLELRTPTIEGLQNGPPPCDSPKIVALPKIGIREN